MNKSKVLIPIFIVLLVVVSIGFIQVKSERDWLQKNIDQIFQHNFSELNTNIMTITLNANESEEVLSALNDKVTKCGSIADTLFSMTSYRENTELGLIVSLLEQSSGNYTLNSLNMTEELNRKLTEIMLNDFSNEELITETLDLLKKSITKK